VPEQHVTLGDTRNVVLTAVNELCLAENEKKRREIQVFSIVPPHHARMQDALALAHSLPLLQRQTSV